MLGLAPGRDGSIRIGPQYSGSLPRVALIFLREFLQSVVGLLVHQVALLDPSFDARSGTHPRETLLALQNLQTLAILHVAHAVVYGGYLVAQRSLRSRDVRYFQHAMTTPVACRQCSHGGHGQTQSNPMEIRSAQQSHDGSLVNHSTIARCHGCYPARGHCGAPSVNMSTVGCIATY